MASPALKAPTTLDEFLAWEDEQAERYEFLDGLVRMLTGGTEDHGAVRPRAASPTRWSRAWTACSICPRSGSASRWP
jgi:hypothetical protein